MPTCAIVLLAAAVSLTAGEKDDVAIHTLADKKLILDDVASLPLDKLVLDETPWITSGDILCYDLSVHVLYLKKGRQPKWPKVALKGTPFVVAANKQDVQDAWPPEDLRFALKLDANDKVLPCVATDKGTVKNILLELLYSILDYTQE